MRCGRTNRGYSKVAQAKAGPFAGTYLNRCNTGIVLKPPRTTVGGGWSGGAMVLGKLSVPGRPTYWIREGQGPTVLALDAGRGCLDIFSLVYHFSFLSPSLWETARYRLKYCLKGPLSPKQPTNQPITVGRSR